MAARRMHYLDFQMCVWHCYPLLFITPFSPRPHFPRGGYSQSVIDPGRDPEVWRMFE